MSAPRRLVSAVAALGLFACQQPAKAPVAPTPKVAAVDAARLTAASGDVANWLTHGRTYDEQRYSPLAQVTTDNVKDLSLAWYVDLDTDRGQEATPLVIDGVMYSTSAWSKVQAVDAATGKELWQYDPHVPGETGVRACCDVVNRGVAAWNGRIYVGTLDGRLVALDAATGKEVWSVVTVDQSKRYTITGAPRIIKGKVLIGNGGAEFGVRGYISAYDADTGKMVWRFYTVPGDPSKPFESPVLKQAAATWAGEWWKQGGGGTVWDSVAYDPELDLLYVGTGNGSPWNQRVRSANTGDNLFLSSIVALRPDTGEYVWHYQETPGDQWDYTATQHIVLANLMIDGQLRKVLMQAPKSGFFYVLDRTNGKLISAEPYAMLNWAKGVDLATGRPNIDPNAYYSKTGKPWLALPGPYGAHNWQPMSFSQQTGLVYIPALDTGFAYIDNPKFTPQSLGFNLGLDMASASMPQDPVVKAQVLASIHGYLKAWDPVAKKEVWHVSHEGAWNGGVLSTAGGLVFQGDATGTFAAYGARDGKPLWSYSAQTGVIAAPMSYAVAGIQYVAIVVGWGGTYPLSGGELAKKGSLGVNRSRILAFKLGGAAQLPAPKLDNAAVPEAPPRFGDEATLAEGKGQYSHFCGTCHGDAVVGGGVVPDLRNALAIRKADSFASIVLGGSLKDQGMVGFSDVLTPAQAEAIRAYVVGRANDPR
ncbi:MAG TPA: PQQ-dependent dehydrogenase, methanol/ethanol family [Polyangiaceae bacterium]|jgi:alcohol dehydrogenase (cytochrome c)/quinohemoprotein ethanol dehydrogenase|nr:PQQ-dependent dehydrogenase, methanol/ethanol family [Polyangiaceae bacterium]